MCCIIFSFLLLGLHWNLTSGFIPRRVHHEPRRTTYHEASPNKIVQLAESFLISQQPNGVSRESLQSMIASRQLRQNFVVVVTGATGGIGQSLCRTILAMNGLVVGVDYDEQALLRLSDQSPDRVRTIVADFRDLNSVSAAADSILSQVSQVDIVVCNAGIAYLFDNDQIERAGCSKQGYDDCFQINYLGHFLLTKRLAKKMDTTSARVVHVTSSLSWTVDGSGLEPFGDTDPAASRSGSDRLPCHVSMAYGNSKLAQIWHSAQLNREGITSICACPSWAATGIAGSDEVATELLAKLAFAPDPKMEGEVAGPALRSILNAMFLPTEDLDDGLLSGCRLLGNSRVVDTIFSQENGRPNSIISFVSRFVPREKFLTAVATNIVMLFQRWSHADLILQKTSYESLNKRGQIALYEWSEQAVSQWLNLDDAETSAELKSQDDDEDLVLVV